MTVSKTRSIVSHLLVWLVIVAAPMSWLRGEALAEEIRTSSLLEVGSDSQLPAELSSVGHDLAAAGSTRALPLSRSSGALRSNEAVLPEENPWAVRKWIPLLLLIGISAGITFGIDSPDSPRWTDNNDFDDSARGGAGRAQDQLEGWSEGREHSQHRAPGRQCRAARR
jgi:hypothetical protein